MSLLKETISMTTAIFLAISGLVAEPSVATMTEDVLQVTSTDELVERVKTTTGFTDPVIITTGAALQVDDESIWYRPQIPMKKEHQKLLWDYCNQKKLDYIDMLALISLESNFEEKCSSGRYKGYFQISTIHHKNLSKILNTPNKPLDGAVNLNWGTSMYSWILTDKRVKDLKGKEQRDVALSIYQRGSGGYNRNGINKKYLGVYYKKRDKIVSYFEKPKSEE